jgi:DNA modification methylase
MIEPFYQDEYVTIYHDSNLDVLPLLSPVDLLVTDPPYGVGKAEWDIEFPVDWIESAKRIAPRMLVMTGNSALIKAGAAFGDDYRDCIVLRSLNGMTRSKVAFGNWIPTLAIGDWAWEGRPNYLEFIVSLNETINHPSPKPLEAMRKLLRYFSKPDWTICDPFMGSGTTLLAAKQFGNKAIGIEIREEYCEEAARRLERLQVGMFARPVKSEIQQLSL